MMRTVGAVLLIVLGLGLSLVLAEVVLRRIPLPNLDIQESLQAPRLSQTQRAHPILGRESRPRTVVVERLDEHPGGSYIHRTNNLGLRRDSDTTAEKAPNLFRVLVLGDSHVHGYVSNDENFTTRLEDGLAETFAAAGKRLEVLNAGVTTYSTAQELLWFRVNGAALKPDVVLVGFYPGNDVGELLDPGRPNVDPASGAAIPPRQGSSAQTSTAPQSDLLLGKLARYAVEVGPLAGFWRQFGLPGRTAGLGGYTLDTLVQALQACRGCYAQSLGQAALARRDPLTMRDALSRAIGMLIRLDSEVRQIGGRLIVAVLPTRPQLEPVLARREAQPVAELLGLDESAQAFDDEVAAAVVSQLSAADVPTISLREPLSATHGEQSLYYSDDWHMNPLGHQLVAAALQRSLSERGLLAVGDR